MSDSLQLFLCLMIFCGTLENGFYSSLLGRYTKIMNAFSNSVYNLDSSLSSEPANVLFRVGEAKLQ